MLLRSFHTPSKQIIRAASTNQKSIGEFFSQHLSFPFLQYKEHLHVAHAEKQFIYDTAGKRYLDFFAGIVTVGVGHCHPKLIEAANKQMNKYWHLSTYYLQDTVKDYATKLLEHFKDDPQLSVCLFVNSGSEANDLALHLAREYTKQHEVISLRNSYHGVVQSTLGLTNITGFKRPYVPGSRVAMNPDPYRGIWGGRYCRDSPIQTNRSCNCSQDHCQASDRYVEQLEELLNYEVSKKKVAGMWIESIQGYGGTVQFPKGYVKRATELVQQNGGLYVADEVQSGFGRTGTHFWGYQAHGAKPDIVVMAKAIANGFPFAAIVTRPEIAKAVGTYFNTYGGNPIGCAVASAVLDVIREEKLQENTHQVGTHLLKRLAKLRDQLPDAVGDVRGKGFLIGMEMVMDKETRKPFPVEKMNAILDRCRHNGLLLGKGGNFGSVFRITPPMCITKEDADFAVDVLEDAIRKEL
ncbi:unnamed protein product [Adineta ricciae]|uniref:Alanine--glyoxylate aminotransferase 2, mitochondrial n=1 Tax=Adineta ricciae TaxID=249248 RepID=A0A815ZY56_ADIRI|nr:unnamed protein product [Adineta ricciae]